MAPNTSHITWIHTPWGVICSATPWVLAFQVVVLQPDDFLHVAVLTNNERPLLHCPLTSPATSAHAFTRWPHLDRYRILELGSKLEPKLRSTHSDLPRDSLSQPRRRTRKFCPPNPTTYIHYTNNVDLKYLRRLVGNTLCSNPQPDDMNMLSTILDIDCKWAIWVHLLRPPLWGYWADSGLSCTILYHMEGFFIGWL